jgi:aldehyde:ferredoxin oxidoreductase
MGSKGIKAIVIDTSDGEPPPIADKQAFRDAQKAYNKALLEHPQTTVYAEYGTAAMTMMSNGFGGLPTRSFSMGEFEEADEITGENLRDLLLKRGGKADPSHACMVACAIRCSNVFANEDGSEVIVSPLEYETIGLMGSNLGIADLDMIARLNWEVNDLGLDSIEIGAALGVAADGGQFEFGDGQAALNLLAEIRKGSEIGKAIGNGAVATGKHLGVKRVPVVKGQAMSAYDPRAIKGTGVTYATTPQGADHTTGLTIRAKVDHLDPKGQVEISRNSQINVAGYDTLGVCSFATFGFGAAPETIPALLNAVYGGGYEDSALRDLGKETLRIELEFNKQAGFSKEDNRIPTWMKEEPLPPHQAVFDVPDNEIDQIFDDL